MSCPRPWGCSYSSHKMNNGQILWTSLVTRAALPYFSAKQLKISPGMLDNLLSVVTFGGSVRKTMLIP